jgi:cytochrome bd-type quinol oxidase subunit 2
VTLGALLQGIRVPGRAYAGGWWDWLTPFSLLTGASVVAGYSLLARAGSTGRPTARRRRTRAA